MPKDTDGNLEMKHFDTKEECIHYIDGKHGEEEEKHCSGGYWYEKYLALQQRNGSVPDFAVFSLDKGYPMSENREEREVFHNGHIG